MKICVINSLYKPYQRGGSETIVAQQVKLLREQGHDVFVITTSLSRIKGRVKMMHEIVDGVRVYRLSSRNLCSFFEYTKKSLWFRLLWLGIDIINIFAAREVVRASNQEKPDLIYTHNVRGLSYLLPRKIKRLNIKHYHILHDIQLAYPSGLLIKGKERSFLNTFFLRRWYEKFTKWLFGSPDKVLAPSQWLLDFYVSRGFFENSEREVKRPELKYKNIKKLKHKNNQQIQLLYVGQMEEAKGIFFLVQALKRIQNSEFRIQIDIVGDGSKLKETKQLVKDDERFVFHGQVSHEQIGEYFAKADITVVPSLTYENAPTVISESLSQGTPVLASRIGGIPELIEEGKTGWLFEAGDVQSLLSKLLLI